MGNLETGPSTIMGARVISLGPGLAAIPERLLLAHARGEVLFLAGAGISQQVGLPDFRDLVLKVYEKLDTSAHGTLFPIPKNPVINGCLTYRD